MKPYFVEVPRYTHFGTFSDGVDMRAEVGPVFNEPLHAVFKPGKAIDEFRIQRLNRKKRDQPDQWPDF